MRRFLEVGWAREVAFGLEGGFAGPQSRDFKRYIAKNHISLESSSEAMKN
jgi:hypothetical protein